MIRTVLDTNIVVSGLLWSGTPSRVIHAVRAGVVQPIVSEAMLDELADVIDRPKFVSRLRGQTPDFIVAQYTQYVEVIEAQVLSRVVANDPGHCR